MVFELLKNIVLGHKEEKARLYKQNEYLGTVDVKISDNEIEIFTDEFDVTDIKQIANKKDHLVIKTKEAKYRIFDRNHDQIYEMIHPIIEPEKTLFESDDFDYYVYDTVKQCFTLVDLDEKKITVCEDLGGFYLSLEEEERVVHFQPITSATQYYMDKANRTVVWSIFKERKYQTFSIKFKENLDFLKFLTSFVECTYRSVNEDGTDSKYFEEMFVTVEEKKEEEKEDWTEYAGATENSPPEFVTEEGVENRNLVVDDRSVFVTRGRALGVFDTNLNFRTQVVNAFDNPSKVETYRGHSSLLGQTKKDELSLLDLEKGEVVDRWSLKEMNDFFHAKRRENDGTLVGIGDYSLFRIDPRTKEKVVEAKEYKTKNEFKVGIATERGDVAVASAKGDLRLYNDVGKRAKSLINGFGDCATGIDSSKSGSLVLCTYKSYILLYEVGSDYSIGLGRRKKSPRRLHLKPEHLALINAGVCFTVAKFDQNDRQIVSSTGKYLIRWNVADVLENKVHRYSIRTFCDEVVDENFAADGEGVIVALPNDVRRL
ncbi:VID27 [Enterospora canceri]|uniref:VID27 n=1 Tax=Enterospora canceri TaxID=1081671 RepID=A0A1Y1S8D3_9MICR|nr:VID27 [Enterospora canceri]